jgi:hypothetical protein
MATTDSKYPAFNAYKGLQKPLMFRGFKGKFIYMGFASIIGALILCVIISTITTFMWGGLTLVIIMVGGLSLTASQQKKGLHKKDKRKGIFIVSHSIFRSLLK